MALRPLSEPLMDFRALLMEVLVADAKRATAVDGRVGREDSRRLSSPPGAVLVRLRRERLPSGDSGCVWPSRLTGPDDDVAPPGSEERRTVCDRSPALAEGVAAAGTGCRVESRVLLRPLGSDCRRMPRGGCLLDPSGCLAGWATSEAAAASLWLLRKASGLRFDLDWWGETSTHSGDASSVALVVSVSCGDCTVIDDIIAHIGVCATGLAAGIAP